MNNVEIRQAQEGDLTAILDLYRQPEMDGKDVLSIKEASKVFKRISRYPNYKFYIARDVLTQVVVGVFALLVMDNLGHHGSPSAIVEGVCVAESVKNQGVGRLMMIKAIEISKQAGCYKVSLSSNQHREGAHAFYQRLGFKQHGLSFYTDSL